MDEKELKLLEEKLAKLGDNIDAKLEDYAKKAKDLSKEESQKALAEIKKDLESELAAYVKQNKELQNQVDSLEVKMKRGNFSGASKKSFADTLKEALTENDSFAAFKARKSSGTGEMFLKTPEDMTQANSFESTTVVPPEYQPGIVYDPDRSVRVRDFISQGVTSSNLIKFVQEFAFDDNTDITAEGSEYKQGDFDLKAISAEVYKITNYIVISEEMLEDVDGLVSYISVRLPSKLKLKEDLQLLYGTGNSEIKGITAYAAAYVDSLADSDVSRYDVIVNAINQATIAEYRPTAIMLHPTDAMQMKLTKDDNGNYIFPWIFQGGTLGLDGVPIILSTAITQGDFLVGDFRLGAQVFDRRQASIEFSNQNEDNFIKGMLTVRASERLALAVYRNNAFVYGTFAAALAQGSA